ncbi:MAG: serine/threonine protein kinase [Deltaproteobacteria bacterium]|nr:serine/threonine protein kinase [Deltaproteobacteria bacterium]
MIDAANAGGIPPPSLGRGAAIGRYIVLGLVGRGAMGEVYAAYDPELDRKVAVKLLRTQVGADDLTAAEAKSRLLREAQAIARLSHPNVIVVHDVGSFGDRVFVAMEFVDGNTVGYWLLAAKRSWKEVLRVFMAAGHGLAAAHASQLVHRDFKVENVMVGRDGQVRVMDFGLARRVAGSLPTTTDRALPSALVGAEDENLTTTRIIAPSDGAPASERASASSASPVCIDIDATNEIVDIPSSGRASGPRISGPHGDAVHTSLSTNLTHTGAILGTPAYMAPEQFNGDAADERSDQFSFCVALYEGLYGERPFAGSTVGELSDNVRKGHVLPAPAATRVPGWLRRVVLRGLRIRPAERWPSVDALLAALQKDPGVMWRRWSMVAAATAGIAVLGMAARRQGALDNRPTCQVASDRFSRVWEPAAAPGNRRASISSAFRASGQPYAAAALMGTSRLLDGYVAAWSAMYTDSCEATNMRGEQSAEVLDLRMSCLRDRWSELRALSDVLVEPDSDVVTNAVKAASALTSLERCADVRTLRAAVPPPNDMTVRKKVEVLRTKLATAKALEDAGRFAKALTAAAPLVSDARATGYAPIVAEAFYRLGAIQTRMSRPTEAENNFDEAIWIAQAARYDEIVAAASIDQIHVAGAVQEDLPKARRWFRQAEAVLARMDGHELLKAWMQHNFGVALESHGDLEEAAARYRTALQIKERVLGGSHPDVGLTLTNLAMVSTTLGRPQEALEHSNRGVEIMEQAAGTEHPDTAVQWANRAAILNQVGRYADAAHDAERALAVWEKELGPENADLPFFLGPLGEAYLGLERPLEAVVPLNRALALAERHDVRSELRKLRFDLARGLWRSESDRRRAINLGSLAALPLPAETNSKVGRALALHDRQLQQAAAEWVRARVAEIRAHHPVGGRFARGPAL